MFNTQLLERLVVIFVVSSFSTCLAYSRFSECPMSRDMSSWSFKMFCLVMDFIASHNQAFLGASILFELGYLLAVSLLMKITTTLLDVGFCWSTLQGSQGFESFTAERNQHARSDFFLLLFAFVYWRGCSCQDQTFF